MQKIIKINYLIFVLLFLFSGCKTDKKISFHPEIDPISDIATVILLHQGENVIYMEDYINDFAGIDSIYYDGKNYTYNKEQKTLIIKGDNLAPISQIKISKQGNIYNIICKKPNKLITEIEFDPQGKEYISVSIAGDFNSWNPTTNILNNESGLWKTSLSLDEGIYQYQIVADEKWMNNSVSGDTASNGIGGYNTILMVKESDSVDPLRLETDSFDDKNITICCSMKPDKMFILWQNQIIPIDLNNFKGNKYQIEIPEESKNLSRSYIRVYATVLNKISNDILIPLNSGKVLYSTTDVLRTDKFANIMYFVLVDRFYNGNTSNDKKVNDPRVDDKSNYQGGDLFGLLQKIKDGYFENLGVNCIWVSPIFRNPDEAYQEFPEPHRYFSGYHGYWPVSSTEIDYRFGNDSIFEAVVENVHNDNMNIILDFVANHVHKNHTLYQSHKDWATELNLPDGRQNIRLWEEQRLTTWFDTFLPSWDFAKPEVTDTISEYAMYWIGKFNIDGFRHDATKHIPEVFWRTLTKKIKSKYPDKSIYQIGETFGSRELIGNYIGSGMMDGQFDFNLYFDARNAFSVSDVDFRNLSLSLKSSFDYYGYHNLMGNISGNHDLIRFISFADKSVLPGEDDKEAGWSRKIKVENESSYKKLQCLQAFILSIPGIPCLYYGDEIGLPGVGDPDNRRMMKFTDLSQYEQETKDIVSKLIKIRKNNIEFLLGSTTVIIAQKNTLVIKRKYFGKESYIIFNQSDSAKEINLPKNIISNISLFTKNFDSKITELSSSIQISLKPYSFEILIKKT